MFFSPYIFFASYHFTPNVVDVNDIFGIIESVKNDIFRGIESKSWISYDLSSASPIQTNLIGFGLIEMFNCQMNGII